MVNELKKQSYEGQTVTFYIGAEDKKLIEEASEKLRLSVSSFVRAISLREAQSVLGDGVSW